MKPNHYQPLDAGIKSLEVIRDLLTPHGIQITEITSLKLESAPHSDRVPENAVKISFTAYVPLESVVTGTAESYK